MLYLSDTFPESVKVLADQTNVSSYMVDFSDKGGLEGINSLRKGEEVESRPSVCVSMSRTGEAEVPTSALVLTGSAVQ